MRLINKCVFFLLSLLFASASSGEEKNSTFDNSIVKENNDLKILKEQLVQKCLLINELFSNKKDDQALLNLKEEVKKIKEEIFVLENKIRKNYIEEGSSNLDDSHAFWDQGETTLSQLIMEYGSADFLYVIPPELALMKISLFSAIPIPRAAWGEMIEAILSNNGIGVKQINSFLRQLYIMKQDLSSVEVIATDINEILHLSDQTMIFFIFSPSLDQVKAAFSFFERYGDPKQVNVQIVGNKVVIVSTKKNIQRLINLHEAIWGSDSDKIARVVKLSKLNSSEVEKVIKSFFGDFQLKNKTPFFQSKLDEVVVLPLPDNTSLVLIGDKTMVQRTEQMINELESQLDDPGEMTIFWYTCKHSDPQDIADVLAKVYSSIASSSLEGLEKKGSPVTTEVKQEVSCETNSCERLNTYNPINPVQPGTIQPGIIEKAKKVASSNNFVVDNKTGSILMTVKKEELEKIKNLLKKLDVPKKMAQIDVLLVERKLQDRKQTGINILKIGTNDVKNKQNSVSYDTNENALRRGLLEFVFKKPKGHFPSYDFTLSFLMAQEDLKINANPSVLAINQTPATISIVEEISISNGAVQVNCPSGWNVEKSYTRAQFGITIVMTPTIHLPDPENLQEKGFVTLHTNVTFDTSSATDNDRPPVTRRHIENEVQIADGETIILGGLRKKSEEDIRDKIPFLGDIPGIGKLFGTTKLTDHSTEMFIFITPKIIRDPIEDLRIERQNFFSKRPGDLPEFLEKVERAKKCERKCLFENSLKVLFEK